MKQTAFFKKYLPIIITAVVGAVGGYLYYRFVDAPAEPASLHRTR